MDKAETIDILDSSMDMFIRDEEDSFLATDELALQDIMKKQQQQ